MALMTVNPLIPNGTQWTAPSTDGAAGAFMLTDGSRNLGFSPRLRDNGTSIMTSGDDLVSAPGVIVGHNGPFDYDYLRLQSFGGNRVRLSIANTSSLILYQPSGNGVSFRANGQLIRTGSGSLDLFLSPLNDGRVEINSGTIGQYRDLIARRATFAGDENNPTTFQWSGGSAGTHELQVYHSGTRAVYRSPSGAHVFISPALSGTSQDNFSVDNSSGVKIFRVFEYTNGYSTDAFGLMRVCYVGSTNAAFQFSATAGTLDLGNNKLIRFRNHVNAQQGTPDLGLSRSAEGVLEINSGTAGQHRDIIIRSIFLSGLDTSDPEVASKVYVDENGFLKLSAG